jgi:hypothetical protein
MRYHIQPKAQYEMRSVALFRQHFQLLAEVHFRGAPKEKLHEQLLININSILLPDKLSGYCLLKKVS